jgi:hypothetical protein
VKFYSEEEYLQLSKDDRSEFAKGGRITNSKLFRQDYWTQRVPFLQNFNFFSNLPRHTSILFQKQGDDYSATTQYGDEMVTIAVGNFFEFIISRNDYNDFTEWSFIIKPTIFLRKSNDDKLMQAVLIAATNQLEVKYKVNHIIKTKLGLEPITEELDNAVATINKGFFKLENFASTFGSELNFEKGGVIPQKRAKNRSEIKNSRPKHRSEIRKRHRSEK